MTHRFFLILLAIIPALSLSSCKCNQKSNNTSQPTQEEVLAQKQFVADSVLAIVDAFELEFINKSDKCFPIPELFALTADEKMVKPDYLLEPSVASTLVTRTQKINALAYYTLEFAVRDAYGMPLDEVKEVIAKLSLELNFNIDPDYLKSAVPESEKISKIYELCKENGDVASFWQYQCAFIFHTDYIIACNPQLYIPKISEEALKQFNLRLEFVNNAATALAPYDPEMASLLKEIKEWDLLVDESEWDAAFATESSTAHFYINNKQAIIDRRNRMLQ